jgi:hypothetical protein
MQALDAVCARGQRERPLAERDRELAAQLGAELRDERPAPFLKLSEPMRDAHVARPPEGLCLGKILQNREVLAPQHQQLANDVVRQPFAIAFGELTDCSVDHDAAVARTRGRIDRIQRPQPQQVLRVNAVRIAQPMFNLRHR